MPTFSDIKEIYLLRNKIFTVRFFPLFISVLLFLYVVPKYGINSKEFIYNMVIIVIVFFHLSILVRFKEKIKYIDDKISKGDFLIAYQELNSLQNESLWESELIKLHLYQTFLFYKVGNFNRFILNMNELSKEISNYPKELFFYRLLNAFKYEVENDFANAKIELEYIIENTKDDNHRAQSYNNIARLEKLQGNNKTSQIFYTKAYILAKQEIKSNFIPIFMHNLLMIYATNNENEKAKVLLKEAIRLINKNNPQDMIEYTNNMTHYARQISDKDLLHQSYELINKNTFKLNQNEKFILEVSGLRMTYNDDYHFEINYQKIILKVKENLHILNLKDKLSIIEEFKHVLIQCMSKDTNSKIEDFRWFVQWHISLENDILNSLDEVESSLSSVKVYWLEQIISLNKSKIAFPKDDYLPIIKKIMGYFDEIINIWKDSNNPLEQVHSLIKTIDYIFSISYQTRDYRIKELYNEAVSLYLDEADKILEENWKKPDTADKMIGISYFAKNIKNDKKMASKWINRFDSLNLSLNHYAEFIKNEYKDVKIWL